MAYKIYPSSFIVHRYLILMVQRCGLSKVLKNLSDKAVKDRTNAVHKRINCVCHSVDFDKKIPFIFDP